MSSILCVSLKSTELGLCFLYFTQNQVQANWLALLTSVLPFWLLTPAGLVSSDVAQCILYSGPLFSFHREVPMQIAFPASLCNSMIKVVLENLLTTPCHLWWVQNYSVRLLLHHLSPTFPDSLYLISAFYIRFDIHI